MVWHLHPKGSDHDEPHFCGRSCVVGHGSSGDYPGVAARLTCSGCLEILLAGRRRHRAEVQRAVRSATSTAAWEDAHLRARRGLSLGVLGYRKADWVEGRALWEQLRTFATKGVDTVRTQLAFVRDSHDADLVETLRPR